MTNTMLHPMTGTAKVQITTRSAGRMPEALRRARRRRALWNTVLEALATMGMGACIILCAVALLCVA